MPNRELVIRIQLPRFTRRVWTALAVVLLLAAGGIVYAGVNWTPFANGEKLSSTKMNANFQALADATVKPHLVLNNGNVDLGVYLGQYSYQGLSYLAVLHPTLKVPLAVALNENQAPPLFTPYFTGANCTGTALFPGRPGVLPYSNAAGNSDLGTIFQTNGTAMNQVAVSWHYNNQCMPFQQPQLVQSATLLKDSGVPNVVVDLTQTSLVPM